MSGASAREVSCTEAMMAPEVTSPAATRYTPQTSSTTVPSCWISTVALRVSPESEEDLIAVREMISLEMS